jgi:hypothetical protein
MAATAAGTMSDSALAPWLPPKMTMRIGVSAPSGGNGLPDTARTRSRTGLPVTTFSRFSVSANFVWAKLMASTSAKRPSARLARPITAFCSCNIPGMPRKFAARNGGKVG